MITKWMLRLRAAWHRSIQHAGAQYILRHFDADKILSF